MRSYKPALCHPLAPSPFLPLTVSLTACFLLLACASVQAGLPHWLRRPAAGPSDTYAPQMRHYIVVDPTVVGAPTPSKDRHLTKVPPPGQVLWRQNVEAVPAYPWGWFGARRQLQNAGQVRYYHNERDWSYLRGD